MTTTNPAADEISFASSPSLATGDAVFYENGGGTSIGGLNSGQTYYVIEVDATHIKLASTFNNAVNNQPVFLTSPGTGSNQSLVVKPTGFDLAGVTVPLPIPIGGQLVSVTAAGAGGTSKAGAGAVNLNFVRMNVDAHIANNSDVQAGGDVDVESSDTSEIGSGTGSVAISVGGGLAVNASVGLNDISNSVKAYVEGSTAQSGGAVNITATETAQDINVVVGGAGSASGSAFGGSFAINFITNTVDAHIAASGGLGMGGTPSSVTASGPLSVLATDTASIATLAGNIGASLGGSGAGAAAVAVNDIADTDTATIEDSTASSGGAITVNATFAKPTELPPGLDVQIAAMSVSGAGASSGAFAGSLSLNWVDNTVEAEVSNIASPQFILAGGTLSVLASDSSTIESLAGAVAIAGVGAKGASGALGASVSFNYLGGDPSNPSSTKNNVVRAAVENVTGSLKASQIDVGARYTGQIDNITVAGSAAVGQGALNASLGGSVSINIIRNTTDAHISGSPDIATTASGAGSLDVEAVDSSTIEALAGGIGIAIAKNFALGLAARVSVASNEIENTTEAYVDSSHVKSAGDVLLLAESMPLIKALSIGVAVATSTGGLGGIAGSGAGAGSGDTVENLVRACFNNSNVSSDSAVITVIAADSPTIETIAGALGVGVASGFIGGIAASVGISVSINDVQDTVQAYSNNSTVNTTVGDVISSGMVELKATENATIMTVTVGGAVAVGIGGGEGTGLAVAGSDSSNTIQNNVDAYVSGKSTVTAHGGSVAIDATDTSSITAGGGGLAVAVGGGSIGSGLAADIGFAVATNEIENSVLAYVDDSTCSTGFGVTLAATENATIFAVTVGGAVALSAGATAFSAAGAGGNSTNALQNTVEAYLAGGASVTTTAGGDVTLMATDSPNLTAKTVAASVSFATGGGAGTFAIGAAIADNTVEDTVEAYSASSTINSAGQIALGAIVPTTASIQATSVAASVALTAAPLGAAFSGAGTAPPIW